MQTKNKTNSTGNRDGYWEEYYSNGNLSAKGHYKNGVRSGYWEQYYTNGNLWYKGSYKNGKKVGYWEYYYYDGNLDETIFYAN